MFEFVFSARLLAQSCFLRGYFSCMRVEDNTQHLFSLAGSRRKLLKDLMKYDLCGKREVKISIFGDISHMYGYICMYVYCTMVLYLYVVEKHTKKHMYVHVQVEIFTYRYLGGLIVQGTICLLFYVRVDADVCNCTVLSYVRSIVRITYELSCGVEFVYYTFLAVKKRTQLRN